MTFDKSEGHSEDSPGLIYSSDRWLVFSKPAGWLTIPGRGLNNPILSEWARTQFGPVWVVHRLDVETSGLTLFARTAEAHRQANTWFEQRKMKKAYCCLARGVPTSPIFKVATPVPLVGGASASTQVEVKESYAEGFYAQVNPLTGRRHQIRIHLASLGFPLWGDPTYGGPQAILFKDHSLDVERVALHALSLQMPSGEKFEAPLPQDFQKWLAQLRKAGTRV